MVWQNSHQTLYCFSGVGSKAPALRPSLALLSVNQNQERTPIDLHLTENVTWKELTAHRPLGRQKALESYITIPTECKAGGKNVAWTNSTGLTFNRNAAQVYTWLNPIGQFFWIEMRKQVRFWTAFDKLWMLCFMSGENQTNHRLFSISANQNTLKSGLLVSAHISWYSDLRKGFKKHSPPLVPLQEISISNPTQPFHMI